MADPVDGIESFETPADAGKGDRGLVRLWLSALDAADKEEAAWRTEAQQAMQRYRQEELTGGTGAAGDGRQDYFNILFASVETVVPALYNSLPVPDARRRFNDKDPMAKYGSQIIERCLSYMVDSYDFDEVMEQAVQDSEIVGRGITKVSYKPYVRTNDRDEETIARQEVLCEHVPWASFRHGPGRVWTDVEWVAFEQFWTRKRLQQEAPGIGSKVELDTDLIEDTKGEPGQPPPDTFKRLRVWEIWDKETEQVLCIAPSYKAAPLKVEPDPLGLINFLPVAPPLYSIRTSDSLVPIPPYRLYKHQAEELDRITRRLMSLISCLRWRGIRDGRLTEFEKLAGVDDGQFVAAQDVAELLATGKLDDAIWMMPIDKLIATIRELSMQREETKQLVFEITGNADIMRGQTDPRETKGAQQIKTQWGSLRLSRRQSNVAQHARDLFRLKSEIMAKWFTDATFDTMANIELPSRVEKQQAMLQIQMMQEQAMLQQRPPGTGARMPPQGGPPGPPSMLGPPQLPAGPNGAERPPMASQGAY